MAGSDKSTVRRGVVLVIAVAILGIAILGRFVVAGALLSIGVLIFGFLHVQQAAVASPRTVQRVTREHRASPWWAVITLFCLQGGVAYLAANRLDAACVNDSGCWVLPTMTIFPLAIIWFASCSLFMRRWFRGSMLAHLLGFGMSALLYISALADAYPESAGVQVSFFGGSLAILTVSTVLWRRSKRLDIHSTAT